MASFLTVVVLAASGTYQPWFAISLHCSLFAIAFSNLKSNSVLCHYTNPAFVLTAQQTLDIDLVEQFEPTSSTAAAYCG